MDAEFADDVFVDFGIDPFFPFARTGLSRIDSESTPELRELVRQFVPRCPGVYGMLDALGRLIYIGKSKLLRNRLLSYFLPNNEEDKAGRIVQSSRSIVWEPQPSEFAALLREQLLIRSFRPRFNVQGIPKRHQPVFICLGRAPAEQLYTSRRSEAKATLQLGPLFGAGRANRAVEVLNRLFRLRDCSSKQACSFTEQLQLFDIELRPGCIRLEIDSCLGPCIAACSRKDYDTQVQRARRFLQGLDDSPIEELERAMTRASDQLHFERAAVLREDLQAVEWLQRRAADLARARERYTFVYPVRSETTSLGHGRQAPAEIWYLIRHGVLENALPSPQTTPEKNRVRRQLKRWLEHEEQIGSDCPPRPETLALVTSWFRNHRQELDTTFLPGVDRAPRRRNAACGKQASKVLPVKS